MGFFSSKAAQIQTQAAAATASKPATGWFGNLWKNITSPQVLSSVGNIVAARQAPQQPSTGPVTTQPYPPGVAQTRLPGAGALPLKKGPAQNMTPWLIGGALVLLLVARR